MLDPATLSFLDPHWLWLLVVPALLLALWVRQAVVRRGDATRLARGRQIPVPERYPIFGDSLFWLFITLATTLLVLALARPAVVVSLVRTGGVDLVVLLDGSASMHVRDVAGDRWQRSVRFLRTLGDGLRWDHDRMALTLFARIAAPQIRLTKDPNTFFFFLDHLSKQSPFPIESDASWDTNIELGLHWGMRVIEKDEELLGASTNAPLFLLISDGQAWSGVVEDSLKLARARDIPVVVVGVGTISGGVIPEPRRALSPGGAPEPPVHSVLDRGSLRQIAETGGGQYYEIDRDSDLNLTNQIISNARRRVVTLPPEPRLEEFYWRLLFAATCVGAVGLLFLRDRGALWVQVAGSSLALAAVSALFG